MQPFTNDLREAPCKSGPACRKFRHRISVAMSGNRLAGRARMSRIFRVLSSLFPRRKPKVSAAYQRVLDPPPPGPPAHRLRAAIRARSADSDHAAVNDNAAAASSGGVSDQDTVGAADGGDAVGERRRQ
jgi:hypothetical protein